MLCLINHLIPIDRVKEGKSLVVLHINCLPHQALMDSSTPLDTQVGLVKLWDTRKPNVMNLVEGLEGEMWIDRYEKKRSYGGRVIRIYYINVCNR